MPCNVSQWSRCCCCNTLLMMVHVHGISAGIEGAFDGAGEKTVIPRKVTGKFSIRLVPDMKPADVEKATLDYVKKLHKESGSPNNMK